MNSDSPLRTIKFRPLPRSRKTERMRPLKTIHIAPPPRGERRPLKTIHIAPPPQRDTLTTPRTVVDFFRTCGK